MCHWDGFGSCKKWKSDGVEGTYWGRRKIRGPVLMYIDQRWLHILYIFIDFNLSNFVNVRKVGLTCSYQMCFYFVKISFGGRNIIVCSLERCVYVCRQVSPHKIYSNMYINQNVNLFIQLYIPIRGVSAG